VCVTYRVSENIGGSRQVSTIVSEKDKMHNHFCFKLACIEKAERKKILLSPISMHEN